MIDFTSIVLVTILPKPRDLEIARLLGWYKIPVRTAPKVIDVDYLAFYQPSSFGEKKWRIEFLAPVRGHELTTRGELLRNETSHPRVNDEYFKIQLGSLIKLPEPILASKWKRLTFLYTTGEYLSKAKTINDLVVRNYEKQVLWKTLHEKFNAAYKRTDSQQESPSIESERLSKDIIDLLLGIGNLKEH